MEWKACKINMKVHVKSAMDSITELGGGDMMKSMVGNDCTIIDIKERCVRIHHEHYGGWWFLSSDLIQIMTDVDMEKIMREKSPPVMFDPANI